ncbi:tetratricopeptide repeat protein [Fluviispira vulneris]|uniref:tetratricopeptide repeat protein n=1 Tax=Fluviispira vulneris TaxID=2763012 RepID=UPI00164860AC|nr:tetratricopeptide repeat protein [Fluviispira vulneris]
MSLQTLGKALYITDSPSTEEVVRAALWRCGAREIKNARTTAEGLDIITKKGFKPHFVVEDLKTIDKIRFFPARFPDASHKFLPPPPCLAICDKADQEEIKLLKTSLYSNFILKPLNESLIEERIRSSYIKSYSYAKGGMLSEAIQSLISSHKLKEAYNLLVPVLAKKQNSIEYITLLSKILFELKEFAFAEKTVKHLLARDKENFSAKNMLAKILIATGKHKEAEKLQL